MAAAAHGKQQPPVAGEADHLRDVVGAPVDEIVEVGGAASPELPGRLRDWADAQAST